MVESPRYHHVKGEGDAEATRKRQRPGGRQNPRVARSAEELQDTVQQLLEATLEWEAEYEEAVASTRAVTDEARDTAEGEVQQSQPDSPDRPTAQPFSAYADLELYRFEDDACADGGCGATPVGTQGSSLPGSDVALYARRTVSALLLAAPTPMRMDDLRKCWQAPQADIRKRSFSASIMGTKFVTLGQEIGFAPHLRTLRSQRHEKLRGFLLFLCAQFLSEQAELSMTELRDNVRLIGREDLLEGFDESSQLKPNRRETPQARRAVQSKRKALTPTQCSARCAQNILCAALDSLAGYLLECEALKYIELVRKPVVSGEKEEAVFVHPAPRLLAEFSPAAFRRECMDEFGVDPPDSRLQRPGASGEDANRDDAD